ncbi:MAG: LamB/YcsF family protein [Muribaculaceae bacterium]|nr:LamB/YcsF family protein [Muribaculaceae bacterium]
MQQTLERKSIKSIDFNCDLAQSYGIYKNSSESRLLDYVSSVNIACGFHAGDPLTIKEALLSAKEQNIVVGAHIGFDDIQGFGYRPMELSTDELEALVMYQVGALMTFAKAYNMEIEHVRPHGAMYRQAAEDYEFSRTIAKGIKKCSKWLIYYGATGENLEKVGEDENIQIAREVHLEKIYDENGNIDYSAKDLENTQISIQRLKDLLNNSQVTNNAGGKTVVNADSIHFSNKLPNAKELIIQAREITTPLPYNYKNAQKSGWVS